MAYEKTKDDFELEDIFFKKGDSQLHIREFLNKKTVYNEVRLYIFVYTLRTGSANAMVTETVRNCHLVFFQRFYGLWNVIVFWAGPPQSTLHPKLWKNAKFALSIFVATTTTTATKSAKFVSEPGINLNCFSFVSMNANFFPLFAVEVFVVL